MREREISSDQMPLAATIGINEENLGFDDLPRDREKVLSKNFRFLFSILEEGGKKALASKLASIQQPYPGPAPATKRNAAK